MESSLGCDSRVNDRAVTLFFISPREHGFNYKLSGRRSKTLRCSNHDDFGQRSVHPEGHDGQADQAAGSRLGVLDLFS